MEQAHHHDDGGGGGPWRGLPGKSPDWVSGSRKDSSLPCDLALLAPWTCSTIRFSTLALSQLPVVTIL